MAGNIPGTPADGNIRTVYLKAVADIVVPKLTELNAVTAFDGSCYHTAGGFAFSGDQATITDARECDTTTRNKPGRKNYSLSITGIDNTNTVYSEDYNGLVETLVEGETIYAIRRRGKAFDAPWEVGDIVTVIQFAPGTKQEVAPEENSVLRSMWPAFVEAVATDVALAA